jgi:phosphonopyruvate decarboxylase
VIDPTSFVAEASATGFGLWSGVPCSYLQPLMNCLPRARHVRYVGAVNEGDAVAIAAGATLGGGRGVAIMQNSGLGNAVNPLTSLAFTARIPVLLIVTWRGEPNGPPDEPQHELMGAITGDMLSLMRVAWEFFPTHPDDICRALDRATRHMSAEALPYAFIMRRGSVSPFFGEATVVMPPAPTTSSPTSSGRVEVGTRSAALVAIKKASRADDVLIAATGYTGRELYACGDAANHFYMVGSMGCAASVALGLALQRPDRRVIVLDGDGAVLMRLGALAVIGHERPGNLIHVVLDNGCYESTGGQATVSATTDLAHVAEACGYPRARRVASTTELVDVIETHEDQLTFVHVPVAPGRPPTLPRPHVSPPEVTARLRQHLQ